MQESQFYIHRSLIAKIQNEKVLETYENVSFEDRYMKVDSAKSKWLISQCKSPHTEFFFYPKTITPSS